MEEEKKISSIYEEVRGYKESKFDWEDAGDILKRLDESRRAIKKYAEKGGDEKDRLSRDTLKVIDDLEEMIDQMKAEREGPPIITPDEIVCDPEKDYLGGGGFGSVYKCQCRGKLWAVKVPKRSDLPPEKLESFKDEIHVLKKVFHPNVVLFIGASTNPIMIVTELMSGGDLKSLIRNPQRYAGLNLEKKLKIAIGISAGMNWLHGSCNIIHRDLKPENILLDNNLTPKISDFGLSDILHSSEDTISGRYIKGTPGYIAPEAFREGPIGKPVDVFAFGIILFELMTGKRPFPQFKGDLNEGKQIIKFVNKGGRPVVKPEDKVKSAIVSFMNECWTADPSVRPTFDEICTRLPIILYETVISEEEARAFWLEYFEKEDFIRFSDLLRLAKSAGVKISSLETILCDGSNGTISMTHFSLLYRWFGPWFRFAEAEEIIEEIEDLLGKKWFHGFISSDVAVSRLIDCDVGTFLVRLSSTESGYPFSISYVGRENGNKTIKHTRVKRISFKPSMYSYGDEKFESLDELLVYLTDLGMLTVHCSKAPRVVSYSN